MNAPAASARGLTKQFGATFALNGADFDVQPAEVHALLDEYVGEAKKAGDPVRLFTFRGTSHFDGINPNAPDWATVMASVQSLLHNP